MNAEKTYRLFLSEIRSGSNASLEPAAWNLFFNSTILKWVNMKQDQVERNQLQTDDLSMITVTTDGLPFKPLKEIDSNSDISVFPVPESTPSNKNNYQFGSDGSKTKYPDYFRLLNAFLIVDGVEIPSESLKTNEEDEIKSNTYLKPSMEKVYHRVEDGTSYNPGGRVFKVLHSMSSIDSFKISYLRKPFPYFFDESQPEDNIENVNLVRGGGSVPCEFNDIITIKIVSMAARLFLEAKSDPRYESLTNEQIINRIIH